MKFFFKSLFALLIFGVILSLGVFIMVPVAIVLTAKVMTA